MRRGIASHHAWMLLRHLIWYWLTRIKRDLTRGRYSWISLRRIVRWNSRRVSSLVRSLAWRVSISWRHLWRNAAWWQRIRVHSRIGWPHWHLILLHLGVYVALSRWAWINHIRWLALHYCLWRHLVYILRVSSTSNWCPLATLLNIWTTLWVRNGLIILRLLLHPSASCLIHLLWWHCLLRMASSRHRTWWYLDLIAVCVHWSSR